MTAGLPELLILTVLLVAAALLVRRLVHCSRGGVRNDLRDMSANRSTASEVLDERYARGEFGRREYERMRQDLAG